MGLNLTNQQKNALDINRHISLTANAGSGKTFVLKKRFVNILLQEGISLNNIVAITFTEKAAAKLYKDIAEEMDKRINEETDRNIVFSLQNYRRDLVSANISTIHSFCIQILKEFSTEAQIDANFVPIDEIMAKEILRLSFESAYKLINKTNENISESIKYLVRFFGSKEKLYSVIQLLIDKRAKIEDLYRDIEIKTNDEILTELNKKTEIKYKLLYEKEIFEIIEKLKFVNGIAFDKLKDKTLAIEVEEILNKFNNNLNFLEILNLLKIIYSKIFTGTGTIKRRDYLKKSEDYDELIFEIENFDLWGKVKGKLSSVEEDKSYIQFCKNLFLFFNEVNKIFDQKKETNNFLDFEDLLLKTTEVVKNPDVVEILAERYKYIMIDEYQDTNDTQYNIFMPILKHLQINNLFVVGDEKQSIYLFRDADLDIFDITKKLIKEKDIKGSLELTHSFRVSPKIALFTNILFSKIMEFNNPIFNEVNYAPLICARKPEDNNIGNISILLTEKGKNEAELVSKKIIEMLKNGEINNFSDVAVLCRQKTDFEDLEKSFTAYKINYMVIGGMGFYQTQLSFDLYHFLNFINNPDSDISLVALLRSPFILLSDTQIALISLEEGKTYFEKLQKYSDKDNKVLNAVKLINKCIKLFETNDTEDVLRLFLTESGYWGILAVRNSYQQEIANLEKFIQLILQTFDRSFFSYYDFLKQLDEYIESFDKENQAQVNSSYPAVKIMTIHKSKGLEFDTVILYNTSEKLKYSQIKAKEVRFDKEFGFMTKVPQNDDLTNDYVLPNWCILAESNTTKKEEAEHKRVFYVAVTRAINNLIISCKYNIKTNFENSFFGYFINAFNPNLDNDVITIEGDLQYLIEGISNVNYKLNFNINIIKNIELDTELFNNKNELEVKVSDKEFLLNAVYDTPKYELFTASKFLAYKFCPIYYNLIYEYSYQKLFTFLSNKYNYQDYSKEDEIEINTDALRIGVVCHEILASKFDNNNLSGIIKEKVEKQLLPINETKKLILDVENLLIPFINSEQYKEIDSFNFYYSEFEINKVVENYYFTGIIDRLIIEKDKIIIVDFKTNKVDEENIKDKIQYYLPQLKYYAFLVGSYFGWEKEIYMKLMFLSYPEYNDVIKIEKLEAESLLLELKQVINNIRENYYISNTKSCYLCTFNSVCTKSILIKGKQ
ncbi:MAG TPA: UvrD-helicase domain-containing protein [Melioribacteraceae bacterium]|nr:UvrD-helicase domain-containing protein [Melioribacteraceae bacterium]